MVAGSLLYSEAQAAPEVCGEPPLLEDTESALLLWKDCGSGTWSVVTTAGGDSQWLAYEGTITADQPATMVAGQWLESNDILDAGYASNVLYQLHVTSPWYDGFDFMFPETAGVCFEMTTPGAALLVGPDRSPVTPPIDLRTMGPCDGDQPCGAPGYNPATDDGTFLWQSCSDGQWHLRVTGGGSGSYTHNVGSITSDQPITSVSPYLLESSDVLDTSQSELIAYDLIVGGAYEDGIGFHLANGAGACVDTGTGDDQVWVGPNRIAVTSPFDLRTLGDCEAAAPPTPPSDVTYQTVSPSRLDPRVDQRNPGKGFEQAGKIRDDGRFDYNTAVEEATDITYIRLSWANLEPNGDNQWNWAPLDAAINDTVSRGKQAALAVISFRPVLDSTFTQAIPSWYIDDSRHVRCTGAGTPAGCTYYRVDTTTIPDYSNGRNLWVFNHDDPIFIQQQVELIEAMRQRYDNPVWAEKIAYIDVRSIGMWSEWRTGGATITGTSIRWPMPSMANRQAIIDAHLAYEHIPQVVNYDNGDDYKEGFHPWDYACTEAQIGGQQIGWRTDGIEGTLWEINQVWAWSDAARECWKLGPVFAEAVDGGGLQPKDLTEGLSRLTGWNASGWNNKWSSTYPNNPAYTAEIDEWLLTAGYRLYVPEATIPLVAVANEGFYVEVDLANAGIAPLYRNLYDLKLRFSPTGSGSAVVVPLSGDLREVLPNEPAVTFIGTGQLPAGEYRVSVGIIEDPAFGSAFPVKLAQDQSSCSLVGANWWCEIGKTTVE